MALNLKPSVGKGMPARKYQRRNGPNPFLEGFEGAEDPKLGTLLDSFERNQDYAVTVKGAWVDDTVKKGPRIGQPVQRLVGEAAEVESMLRAAANALGIGVTIQMEPPTSKGLITIHYLGKVRTQYGQTDDSPES